MYIEIVEGEELPPNVVVLFTPYIRHQTGVDVVVVLDWRCVLYTSGDSTPSAQPSLERYSRIHRSSNTAVTQ